MAVTVAEASFGERVRQGDPGAFEALYQEYGPRIYDFLARLVRDSAAAEDLVQATFIKAFEHRATLREPAKLRSWLWATAHNQAMNHLARQRRSDPLDEQFDLATLARGPEETAEAKDAAELVWLAAASLEPRQYTVLDLTVRRDLSTQEVAETLGIPVGHAAVLVNRAREALGHAVRYLLVARRREQCQQLAALIPAGVRALTPAQRSAVDHHMRRCERCRKLGDRLTAPAELLGTLILLPLPARLSKLDSSQLLSATRPATAGRGARPPKGRRRAQDAARTAGHQALTSTLQAVVTVAVALALTAPQAGSALVHPPGVALAGAQNQSLARVTTPGPVVQAAKSSPSGYASAQQAAEAAANALLKKWAAAAPASTAASSCTVNLGTPTYGVDAAYFAGMACGPSAPGLFTYVYKDVNGWHYLDARAAQAGFMPGIGLQGNVQLASGCVNVRETPGLSSRVVACVGTGSGTTVTVDGGPNYVDQKIWWHLQGLGWMAHDFLICAGPSDGLLPANC